MSLKGDIISRGLRRFFSRIPELWDAEPCHLLLERACGGSQGHIALAISQCPSK